MQDFGNKSVHAVRKCITVYFTILLNTNHCYRDGLQADQTLLAEFLTDNKQSYTARQPLYVAVLITPIVLFVGIYLDTKKMYSEFDMVQVLAF